MAAVRITADDTRVMFMIYRREAKRGVCFIPMSAQGNLIKKKKKRNDHFNLVVLSTGPCRVHLLLNLCTFPLEYTAAILTQYRGNVRPIYTTRFENTTPTGTFPVIRCSTTSSFALPRVQSIVCSTGQKVTLHRNVCVRNERQSDEHIAIRTLRSTTQWPAVQTAAMGSHTVFTGFVFRCVPQG